MFLPHGPAELIGGVYADHAFVLRGGGICGGALDFPAFRIADSGPGFTVSDFGAFVDRSWAFGKLSWLGARPLRIHFVRRAQPCLSTRS